MLNDSMLYYFVTVYFSLALAFHLFYKSRGLFTQECVYGIKLHNKNNPLKYSWYHNIKSFACRKIPALILSAIEQVVDCTFVLSNLKWWSDRQSGLCRVPYLHKNMNWALWIISLPTNFTKYRIIYDGYLPRFRSFQIVSTLFSRPIYIHAITGTYLAH